MEERKVILIDRELNREVAGVIKPPFTEVRGVDLLRLELTSTSGGGYLDYAIEEERLKIHRLQNRSPHLKYVGKELVRAAFDISLANPACGGRVGVDAIDNSHGFYLKMGFVPDEDLLGYPRYGILVDIVNENGVKGDYFELARKLLADFYKLPLKQIDERFVEENWWHNSADQPRDFTPRVQNLIERGKTRCLGEVAMHWNGNRCV